MPRKKKITGPVLDASRDYTEKDAARQKYYELLSEQTAWNMTKENKVSLLAKLIVKILG